MTKRTTLAQRLFEPVDITRLVYSRIAFGAIMLWGVALLQPWLDRGLRPPSTSPATASSGSDPGPATACTSSGSRSAVAGGVLNRAKQWFAPRPLMATITLWDAGLGRSLGSPFYTWAQRAIDIKPGKPGSDPNSIVCTKPKQNIPAALLSVDLDGDGEFDPEDFDATQANPATVRFGRHGTETSFIHSDWPNPGDSHIRDANGDGLTDLVFHFPLADTDLNCQSTFAKMKGQLLTAFSGSTFESADFVRMIERGKKSSRTRSLGIQPDADSSWKGGTIRSRPSVFVGARHANQRDAAGRSGT